MKILISNESESAHFYDRTAWIKVLQHCGHEAEIWDIRYKPAFDAFDEMKPDIFIGQLHNIDRATVKCLQKYRPKVILKAGHYGPMDEIIDTSKYPVLVATEEHKQTAQALKSLGLLDFVCVHYPESELERTMGYWKGLGITPISTMNALDTFSYLGGRYKKEFACDISIVSGYWAYKAQSLNKYILPLCNPVGRYNIRIYGNGHWPVGQYMGRIGEEHVKDIFKSTLINIDCHEPHSTEFGFDVTERIFKVIGAGGLYVSAGKVSAVHDSVFNGCKYPIIYGDTPENFEWVIGEVLNYTPEHIEHVTKCQQNDVLYNHTYFDRVADMFYHLGLDSEGDSVLDAKHDYLTIFKDSI